MATEAVDSVAALKDLIKQYMEKRGYKTVDGAKVLGKSGAEHTFDMLARREGGLDSHAVGICFVSEGEENTEATIVRNCVSKAYDAGIEGKIIIAAYPLSQEIKQLAQKQRIKVIDKEQILALLKSESAQTTKPSRQGSLSVPAEFENRTQLLEVLADMGYRVVQEVKMKGKSGNTYSFNIIAYEDDIISSHSLGIEFLTGEKEVSVEQISSFDVKAYDVGIDDKAIIISAPLSHVAKLFVQNHGIEVLKMKQNASPESLIAEKKRAKSLDALTSKPEEAETPANTSGTMGLQQVPQPEALELIPEIMARRYNIVPLSISHNTLTVAMVDPTDIFALEALSSKSKMRVKPITATADGVREALDLNYRGYSEIERHISQVATSDEITDERLVLDAALDAPLVQALSLIVEEAVKTRASDIHLEPEENRLRIRYRIDGILHDMMSLPIGINRALISRIKILSDMNIADHLRPQDGQFSFNAKGRDIDIRVATVPCVTGEMAVLRLLDKSRASRGLAELGFLPESLKTYEMMLAAPYGMILSSGPTGSGKTTTLYASLNSLDLVGRNVITIEDPAEYRFKDINQIQVNVQAGITFAAGLRSILRLDPNIIMVGEIRDGETANIATQAALTGHLMLSSVHANDAATTLARLTDLKVEPFLVASSVVGVVGQRMVRRVCTYCSHPVESPLIEQIAYERATGEKKTEFLYGVGCENCSYSGYMGRTGIFEIMVMSDPIRELIVQGVNSNDIRTQAIKEGMTPLMKDGMLKVKAGITTPAEVLRSAYAQI